MPTNLPARTARLMPARGVRLFSAALGIALAGGVALAAWAVAPEAGAGLRPPPPMMGMAMLHGMLPPGGPMLDHLLDQVDASALQRGQAHQILDAARPSDAERSAAQADHALLAQAFTQPEIDAAALEAIRARQSARQDAESRRSMQAMLDIGHVLTVPQRQQIAALMAELAAARHLHPGAAPAGN